MRGLDPKDFSVSYEEFKKTMEYFLPQFPPAAMLPGVVFGPAVVIRGCPVGAPVFNRPATRHAKPGSCLFHPVPHVAHAHEPHSLMHCLTLPPAAVSA